MPTRPQQHRPRPTATREHSPRRTTAARGYGKAWQRVSAQVRRDRPVCEECGVAWSECVDHVVSLADGGTSDEHNLRALCWACHSRKTVRQDRGFGRRPGGVGSISGAKPP